MIGLTGSVQTVVRHGRAVVAAADDPINHPVWTRVVNWVWILGSVALLWRIGGGWRVVAYVVFGIFAVIEAALLISHVLLNRYMRTRGLAGPRL